MNRLIRVLRDRRGESMVEILVSTVVFMLLLGALTGGVSYMINTLRSFCLGSRWKFAHGAAPQGCDRTAGKRARECRSRGRRSCRVQF